ncbi:hypothetical protein ABZ557_27380 [Streptomyces sp. NPDC019645]|uniref:hypothetical protein n=1 Tax=Streptomyces sp. NPDC019645 TaxID=3154786 RepID=UPI0033F3A967
MFGSIDILEQDREGGDSVFGVLGGGSEVDGIYKLQRGVQGWVGTNLSPLRLAFNVFNKRYSKWAIVNPMLVYKNLLDIVTVDLGNGVQISRPSIALTQALLRQLDQNVKEKRVDV